LNFEQEISQEILKAYSKPSDFVNIKMETKSNIFTLEDVYLTNEIIPTKKPTSQDILSLSLSRKAEQIFPKTKLLK